MTEAEIKMIDDVIGSHLPAGYREHLLDVINAIRINTYNKAYVLGEKFGTIYPHRD